MDHGPAYCHSPLERLRRRSQVGPVSRWFFSCVLCFSVLGSAESAPYPQEGLLTQWVQPDGTRLILRVFGDEFYARIATDDGYTVIFEPADKTYYYAITGPDGESLVPSQVPAGKTPPRNLPKHLQEPSKVVATKRSKNVEKYAPDRSADWAARKKAVQDVRAREAESKAGTSDPLQPPSYPAKNNEPTLEKK